MPAKDRWFTGKWPGSRFRAGGRPLAHLLIALLLQVVPQAGQHALCLKDCVTMLPAGYPGISKHIRALLRQRVSRLESIACACKQHCLFDQAGHAHLLRQMLLRHSRAARSASAASLERLDDLTMPSSTGRPPPATTMSPQASTASVVRARPLSAAMACERESSAHLSMMRQQAARVAKISNSRPARGRLGTQGVRTELRSVLELLSQRRHATTPGIRQTLPRTELGCLVASRASRCARVRLPSDLCGAFAAPQQAEHEHKPAGHMSVKEQTAL